MNSEINERQSDAVSYNDATLGSSGALMKIFTELATTESKLKKEMLTKKYKKRVRKIFNKMGVK